MENLIENLVTGKLENFRSQIHNSLYEKVAQALEAKKIEVAQKMYCTECSETLEEGKMPPQLAKALAEKKKGGKKDDKKSASKGKKPDFLDLDKDGNKKESMKKAAKDAKKGKK
jgi:hypothetical protein